ncbi:MAG: hypothetical protein WBI20_11070 [Burkholderiaceae bacterium]
MNIALQHPPAGWLGRCRVLSLAALLALAACGGNGGSSTGDNPPPADNPDSTTTLQGFYQASAGPSGQEFLSLILPFTSGSVQWWGWYFRGPDSNADPYLFSGVLDLRQDGTAQSNAAGIKAFTSGALGTGSVSVSNASLERFHASATAVASQTALDFDASAAPSSNYNVNRVALPADLEGRWSGTWSSDRSVYGSSTMTFSNTGALTSNATNFPCSVTGLSLPPHTSGNAFSASLVVPVNTLCSWTPLSTPKTLNGIAFIHTLANSSTRRLELMLLDSDGRGISFRGDQ